MKKIFDYYFLIIIIVSSEINGTNRLLTVPVATNNNLVSELIITQESDKDTSCDEPQKDEDYICISEKSGQQLHIEKIVKSLSQVTNIITRGGNEFLKQRIKKPIHSLSILENRQNIIRLLALNPELLQEITQLIQELSPEIEQLLFSLTQNSIINHKKLYCTKNWLPLNTINKNSWYLATWQIVPITTDFFITILDPLLHGFAFLGFSKNNCKGHRHNHAKKTKFEIFPIQSFSYISLVWTIWGALQNITSYFSTTRNVYANVLKEAQAIQKLQSITQKIHNLIESKKDSGQLQKPLVSEDFQMALSNIRGLYNIGYLAQLQWFLQQDKLKKQISNHLYCLGKFDCYQAIAHSYQNNKVVFPEYNTNNTEPSLSITNGISGLEIPNTFKTEGNTPTIITGPGGSGKSAYMHMIVDTIVTSLSLGVVPNANPDTKVITSLFKYIIFHANVTDSLNQLSTSQTENKLLKDAIDLIKKNDEIGIAFFDELFKHTNPEKGSFAFQKMILFLEQYKKLIPLYTTHYTKIAKKIEPSQKLTTVIDQKESKPTYLILPGINKYYNLEQELKEIFGDQSTMK